MNTITKAAKATTKAMHSPLALPQGVLQMMRVVGWTLFSLLFAYTLFNTLSRQFVWDLDVQKQTALKAVDKSSDFGRVVLNHEGKIISWNKGMTHLLGWTSKEMRGANLSRLIPRSADPGSNDDAKIIREITNLHDHPWKAWGYFDLLSKSGEPILVRAAIRDVTDPKEPGHTVFRFITIDSVGTVDQIGTEQLIPGSKSEPSSDDLHRQASKLAR